MSRYTATGSIKGDLFTTSDRGHRIVAGERPSVPGEYECTISWVGGGCKIHTATLIERSEMSGLYQDEKIAYEMGAEYCGVCDAILDGENECPQCDNDTAMSGMNEDGQHETCGTCDSVLDDDGECFACDDDVTNYGHEFYGDASNYDPIMEEKAFVDVYTVDGNGDPVHLFMGPYGIGSVLETHSRDDTFSILIFDTDSGEHRLLGPYMTRKTKHRAAIGTTRVTTTGDMVTRQSDGKIMVGGYGNHVTWRDPEPEPMVGTFHTYVGPMRAFAESREGGPGDPPLTSEMPRDCDPQDPVVSAASYSEAKRIVLAQDYTPQDSTEGVKYDDGKPRMSLLPPRALMAVASVLGHGACKYAVNNWHHLEAWRIMDAHGRHMALHEIAVHENKPEKMLDPDSGMLHLAHMAANALMALDLLLQEQDG